MLLLHLMHHCPLLLLTVVLVWVSEETGSILYCYCTTSLPAYPNRSLSKSIRQWIDD